MAAKSYNIQEALKLVLKPNSDSELSDLSDGEDEDNIQQVTVQPRIRDSESEDKVDFDNQEKIKSADEKDDEESSASFFERRDDDNKINESRFEKVIPRWQRNKPPTTNNSFLGEEFSLPPDDDDTGTPLNYFQMFWKDDINVLLSEQTNLYSIQRKGTSLNTTSGEIEQFMGIQMYMSIIDFPAYRMYWAQETRYPPVADVMSRNRYQQLREFLHVSDNLQRDNPENTGNKLYKIQPILEHVRNNCIEIGPEQEHSIDE